ncbi:hypothetical protein NDU88_003472 [Pleurodeles waltl]|uniref:Uncharacterized protein n=1 Tax=Pleurodeles waltl TaxID=8319 RepID=A0AAV7MUC5_PLEWA|nr:hypothetical protein NDU88_003472 [Pleurodeles waltl]
MPQRVHEHAFYVGFFPPVLRLYTFLQCPLLLDWALAYVDNITSEPLRGTDIKSIQHLCRRITQNEGPNTLQRRGPGPLWRAGQCAGEGEQRPRALRGALSLGGARPWTGLVGRQWRRRGRTRLEAVARPGLDRRPVVGAGRASACRRRRGSPGLRLKRNEGSAAAVEP